MGEDKREANHRDWREKRAEDWTVLDHHNALWWNWRAVGEFLQLLTNKQIPEGTNLVLALLRGELRDGEVYSNLPVIFGFTPENMIKILESSINADILKKQIENNGNAEFVGKFLKLGFTLEEVEVPNASIPKGYAKCRECGFVFEKKGRKIFCSDKCRYRYNSKKWYHKEKAKKR